MLSSQNSPSDASPVANDHVEAAVDDAPHSGVDPRTQQQQATAAIGAVLAGLAICAVVVFVIVAIFLMGLSEFGVSTRLSVLMFVVYAVVLAPSLYLLWVVIRSKRLFPNSQHPRLLAVATMSVLWMLFMGANMLYDSLR